MNWIERLPNIDLSANKYSQYGEEIIIQEIFKNIGTRSKYYVDLGAGLGISNTRLLKEQGWQGLAFDMNGGEGIIKEFITPWNIVDLLHKYECEPEIDLLSIDLDGFDYDVLKNMLMAGARPSVICAEYNGTLDPKSFVKLKYEKGYVWDGTNKYGFSFNAGIKLFNSCGYAVILSHKDTNMFAVKFELIKDIKSFTNDPKQNIYHPINPNAIWEQV